MHNKNCESLNILSRYPENEGRWGYLTTRKCVCVCVCGGGAGGGETFSLFAANLGNSAVISKSSTSYQDRQFAPTSSQPFSLPPLFLSSTYSFSRLRNFNLGQNRWEICNPLPTKSRMGKWRVLAFARLHPCFGGGWGFAVPFYSVQDCWSPPRHASLSKQTTDDRSHASW